MRNVHIQRACSKRSRGILSDARWYKNWEESRFRKRCMCSVGAIMFLLFFPGVTGLATVSAADRSQDGSAAVSTNSSTASSTADAAGKGSGKPNIRDLVNRVDRLYRHDTSHTLMEMEIETPHWKRTLKMEAWSEGMDKTFIRILEPRKERGMGTLRIDNEMWNYLPKTHKVMKIPPSMMMSSWMGSDFKNNDLVREFTFVDDYNFEYIAPSEVSTVRNNERKDGGENMYYIKCIPKPGKPIVWGHVTIAVKKNTSIPQWQKYYDEDGELMRVMYFREVENFDGKRLPSIMELVPQKKEGHKTALHYIEAEFDIDIEEKIFSLRNLRTFRQ